MVNVEVILNILRLIRDGAQPNVLRSSIDLATQSLYTVTANIIAVSPGLTTHTYVKYRCTKCNYETWSVDRGEVAKCRLCGGIMVRLDENITVVSRKVKLVVALEDAGLTHIDGYLLNVVNGKVLSLRGGRHCLLVYPTSIEGKPTLLVLDTVDNKARMTVGSVDALIRTVREKRDFISRLSTILSIFAIDKVYGLDEEKAILLASIVGSGHAYVGTRKVADIVPRYWLNVAWFGTPERGKSVLIEYIQ